MARSYPYGMVPANIATVVTESFERPMVCCGYCSAHMAARTARGGLSTDGKKEAHAIRAAGGRPHWNGSRSSELRAGLDIALNVNVDGVAKGSILGRLKAGYAVIVSLQYIKLPGYLKVQTNDFGHSAMLRAHRTQGGLDYVGYFDPLYAQGSQGSWAKWSEVNAALWDTGHNTTTVKYAAPEVPPVSDSDYAHAGDITMWNEAHPKGSKEVMGRDGTRIHTTPPDGGVYPIIGTDPDEFILRLPGNVIGWIKKSLVNSTNAANPPHGHQIPPPTTPPAGDCKDEVLAARKVEYQRVTTGSIIQAPKPPE